MHCILVKNGKCDVVNKVLGTYICTNNIHNTKFVPPCSFAHNITSNNSGPRLSLELPFQIHKSMPSELSKHKTLLLDYERKG